MTEREVLVELIRYIGVLTYGKERWFRKNGAWYDSKHGEYIQNEELLYRVIGSIEEEVSE